MIAVCLSTFSGDIQAAQALMKWIVRLGGVEQFDLVICADAGTPFNQVVELKAIAEQAFKTATIISTEKANVGWPTGSNANWTRAAQWAKENNREWLWLEPDAIPLKTSWLREIDAAYSNFTASCYFGHIYPYYHSTLPERLMSGIAVYPPRAIDQIAPLPMSPLAWDVCGNAAAIMVGEGADTKLIRHYWGEHKLPPVFVEAKDANSPINAFTLDWLPPECVLFHRDKTLSLVRILTRKYFPNDSLSTKIVVVFPVCGKDISHAIHHAKWLRSMNRKWGHKAVIAYDYSAHVLLLNELQRTLEPCFEGVEAFHYPPPGVPTYPQAANWAFQCVAHKMSQQQAAWLWMEADAIALTSDWIERLQSEYDTCGKAFMGPVVQHLGHLQGTSIYPANAAQRLPRAMTCVDGAFDMFSKEDIGDDRHDASHLMHHCWSLVNRMSHPVNGGDMPVGITAQEMAAWLPKSAVFLHRVKDFSVLNCLLTGQYRHG